MKTNSSKEVGSGKWEVGSLKSEASQGHASSLPSNFKLQTSNSLAGLVLAAVTAALILAVEPAASQDQSQSQYRRDRSRREVSPDGSSSGRFVQIRPDSGNRTDFSRYDRSRRDPRTTTDAGRSGPGIPDKNGLSSARVVPGSSPQGRDFGHRSSNSSRDSRISGPPSRDSVRQFFDSGPRPGGQDPKYIEQYGVVLSRNMFSRDRVPLANQGPAPTPPVISPESYYLLRGVTFEDHPTGNNQFFVAFVEDKHNGSVLRLHEGDRVARGQIKALTLDGFNYQQDKGDKPVAVRLGTDLEGRFGGAVTASELASFTPPAGGTAAPGGQSLGTPESKPTVSPADEADIVKRLMEQRQQQLGQ